MFRRSMGFLSGGAFFRRTAVRLDAAPTRIQMIKELRQRTDAPMSECAKAVDGSAGDMEKAIELLKKSGSAKAVKKQGRVTEYGVVAACVVQGKRAAVLQVNSETDFAARNEKFLGMTEELRKDLATMLATQNIDALGDDTAALIADLTKRNQEKLTSCISVVGENMTVQRILPVPLTCAPYEDAPDKTVSYEGDAGLVIGRYVHNTLGGFSDIGSIVGVAVLTPTKEKRDAFGGADADEMAQHLVSHYGDKSQLQPQSFLGGEETAGQWMKRHGYRVRTSLCYKCGAEEPAILVPKYGNAPTA